MTAEERRQRIITLLGRHPGIERLCDACVAHLGGITGAGLAVMTTLPASRTRYVSDATSERIEELQFALGEGPCVDAFAGGGPVLAADISGRQYRLRWPAFTAAAAAAGARALFAFPLRLGAIRLGVLDLYRDRPGDLLDDELADALLFADTATLLLLAEDQERDPEWRALVRVDQRAVVHQATGMIMAQLDGTIAAAFARLRARAYAEDRPLVEVAADVVERRLRFDELVD